MKRFILSTVSVLLATSAVAYEAQALPKLDPSFNLQTRRLEELDRRNKGVSADFEMQKLRLEEFDRRNKSEDYQQPYYPESSAQETTYEQESAQSAESTQWEDSREYKWESAEAQPEEPSTELSLTARRQQALDRD